MYCCAQFGKIRDPKTTETLHIAVSASALGHIFNLVSKHCVK